MGRPIQYEKVTITTNGSGAATVYTSRPLDGILLGIYYEVGTLDAGTDVTVTQSESAIPVDTITNLAASAWRKPMIPGVTTAGVATTAPAVEPMPVNGQLKFVVAQGGAAATGYAHVFSE